jgi:hypothetical protein
MTDYRERRVVDGGGLLDGTPKILARPGENREAGVAAGPIYSFVIQPGRLPRTVPAP